MSEPVKRVLLYRLGSLGDTLVALPALHLIRRSFPTAERRLLTNMPVHSKAPPAAAILEGTGLVDGYERYTIGTRSPVELAALAWRIRRWRPEVLVYLGAARGVASAVRDRRFFRLCGIRRQIGVPLTEDANNNRQEGEAEVWEPEAARLARNIAELGDARLDDPASWDLALSAQEQERAAEVLAAESESVLRRPLLAVSVGTKVQSKDWGRENWRALLERLGAAHPEFALALCGAEEEREASEHAGAGWQAGVAVRGGAKAVVRNLCGVLTPRESAAVFARAELFVGHDSGPMHLAAAVQTPCVAVFAARNKPRVWFPYGPGHHVVYHRVDCWGCGLETCVVEHKKCIVSITVAEVATAVEKALSARSAAGAARPVP